MVDLVGTSVATLGRENATRRIAQKALASFGAEIDYTLQVNSIEMAKQFARTGMGVTVLPAIAAQDECSTGHSWRFPFRLGRCGAFGSRFARRVRTRCPRRAPPFSSCSVCGSTTTGALRAVCGDRIARLPGLRPVLLRLSRPETLQQGIGEQLDLRMRGAPVGHVQGDIDARKLGNPSAAVSRRMWLLSVDSLNMPIANPSSTAPVAACRSHC